MDGTVLNCLVKGCEALIPSLILPDPNDRHILAAAIKAGASAIVTFNEGDFPSETLDAWGLHTIHPDEFIVDVLSLDPIATTEAVEWGIKHYNGPPITLDQYLDDLQRAGVPKTARVLTGLRVLFPSESMKEVSQQASGSRPSKISLNGTHNGHIASPIGEEQSRSSEPS